MLHFKFEIVIVLKLSQKAFLIFRDFVKIILLTLNSFEIYKSTGFSHIDVNFQDVSMLHVCTWGKVGGGGGTFDHFVTGSYKLW